MAFGLHVAVTHQNLLLCLQTSVHQLGIVNDNLEFESAGEMRPTRRSLQSLFWIVLLCIWQLQSASSATPLPFLNDSLSAEFVALPAASEPQFNVTVNPQTDFAMFAVNVTGAVQLEAVGVVGSFEVSRQIRSYAVLLLTNDKLLELCPNAVTVCTIFLTVTTPKALGIS